MLKQRVITAVLLLLVLIPAVMHPNTQIFMGLSLLMMGAGAWEWGRLNGRSDLAALGGSLVFLLLSVTALDHGWTQRWPHWLWTGAGAAWVLLGVWMLRAGVAGWSRLPQGLRWWLGLPMLSLAWLALIAAHARGVNFLLSVLVLVWAADVVAYFAGRALGGRCFARKLAPTLSPGKTWEGALGGMFGVLLVAVLWMLWDQGHPQLIANAYFLPGRRLRKALILAACR